MIAEREAEGIDPEVDHAMGQARELLQGDYVSAFSFLSGWAPSPVQRAVAEAMQWLEDTPGGRCMIWAPPSHGKSYGVSTCIAHMLARAQMGLGAIDAVVFASYGTQLARKFSRHARQLVESRDWPLLWPEVRVDRAARGVDEWRLAGYMGDDPSCMAVGIRAGLTGFHTPMLVIDDPYNGQPEADSPAVRQSVWDWWTGVVQGRIRPDLRGGGGRILLVNTRYREDDLSGEILRTEGRLDEGGRWRIVHLKAIDEEGRALWPEMYPLADLEKIRNLDARVWTGQYQGEPHDKLGELIKRHWVESVAFEGAMPNCSRWVLFFDPAEGLEERHDYTGWALAGIDSRGTVWVPLYGHARIDFVGDPATGEDGLIQLIEKGFGLAPHIPRVIEKASVGAAAAKMLAARGKVTVSCPPAVGSKEDRVRAILPLWAEGRIRVRRDCPSWQAALHELVAFPYGGAAHDDIVDAITGAVTHVLDPSLTAQAIITRRGG